MGRRVGGGYLEGKGVGKGILRGWGWEEGYTEWNG